MIYREAKIVDILQMEIVRSSVKENKLSNPNLVTEKDYEEFIMIKGKRWVCETNKQIVGFAIADLMSNNIWALFIHPEFERQGIGQELHKIMLDWYFRYTKNKVWLGTAPNTRAEGFYKKAGWVEAGTNGREIKLEMTYDSWQQSRLKNTC